VETVHPSDQPQDRIALSKAAAALYVEHWHCAKGEIGLERGEGCPIDAVVFEWHARKRKSEADLLAPATGESKYVTCSCGIRLSPRLVLD
jgi:hypothetical protein